MHLSEQVVTDYIKRELREEVHHIIREREKRKRWITIGIVLVFIVYVSLALWIGYIVTDVQKVNDLKRIEIANEAQTDSLKHAKIIEFDKKYDDALRQYYNDLHK